MGRWGWYKSPLKAISRKGDGVFILYCSLKSRRAMRERAQKEIPVELDSRETPFRNSRGAACAGASCSRTREKVEALVPRKAGEDERQTRGTKRGTEKPEKRRKKNEGRKEKLEMEKWTITLLQMKQSGNERVFQGMRIVANKYFQSSREVVFTRYKLIASSRVPTLFL